MILDQHLFPGQQGLPNEWIKRFIRRSAAADVVIAVHLGMLMSDEKASGRIVMTVSDMDEDVVESWHIGDVQHALVPVRPELGTICLRVLRMKPAFRAKAYLIGARWDPGLAPYFWAVAVLVFQRPALKPAIKIQPAKCRLIV